MQEIALDASGADPVEQRAADLFLQSQDDIYRRTDRLFAILMCLQWMACIAAALWISPYTWLGAANQIHWHVWAAVFLGGAITSFPVYMAVNHAGSTLTRHTIAVGQMLTSALLIHLSGGRIETHFHVFGSLAFIACYRDWRVLLTATIVVAVDHFVRGVFWPQSVFGVLTASPWRWIEHAAWVVFENAFLFTTIRQCLVEMKDVAMRRAKLEAVNAGVERVVDERTAELRATAHNLAASEQRFRMLSASAPIGIFETDPAGSGLYTNPQWQKITELSGDDSLGDGWRSALHPDDAGEVFADWKRCAAEGREFSREFRFQTRSGAVRWVHARSAPTHGQSGQVSGHVGTVEDITQRKEVAAKVEAMHTELRAASRQAGMAEVATGVLHNVGNVLNSVNVSTGIVAEKLKKSRVGRLKQVAQMIDENSTNLGDFLTKDEKGSKLPAFLAQLSDHLTNEHQSITEELQSLAKGVEHIKEIVSTQQRHATSAGFVERMNINDLLEDALRIHTGSLTKRDISVVREFAELGPIVGDKHKVLQIVVNLIGNAAHAMEQSKTRTLTLKTEMAGAKNLRVSVRDTGCGIASENMTRIFEHGFTTKDDGHGFGLHSSALAAGEMKGSLTAHSDGLGSGAVFTLDVPITCVEAIAQRQPGTEAVAA